MIIFLSIPLFINRLFLISSLLRTEIIIFLCLNCLIVSISGNSKRIFFLLFDNILFISLKNEGCTILLYLIVFFLFKKTYSLNFDHFTFPLNIFLSLNNFDIFLCRTSSPLIIFFARLSELITVYPISLKKLATVDFPAQIGPDKTIMFIFILKLLLKPFL